MSASSLEKFELNWGQSDSVRERVTLAQLVEIERRFSIELPQEYKSAVIGFGLPNPAIDLLDAIVDNDLAIADVSEFHSPNEIIEATNDWRAMGMPDHLIAFACDCAGNQFAFSAAPEAKGEVWFSITILAQARL